MSTQTRHHYVFQHTILGGLVLREPMEIWPLFQEGHGNLLLQKLWNQAASLIPEPERLPFPDVQYRSVRIRTDGACHLAIILTFPAPRTAGEAHMAALVWRNPPASSGAEETGGSTMHPLTYFTLENTRADDRSATELCAWKRVQRNDLERVSYGEGPAPVIQDFLKAVTAWLDDQTRVAA